MAFGLEALGLTPSATDPSGGALAFSSSGAAASRAAGLDGASGVPGMATDMLGQLEDEMQGSASGLNLGALLGGQDPTQALDPTQQGGLPQEAEQQLIQLMEQIMQLMQQLTQQQAAGDQQGAAQTQDQIKGLQDQMTQLLNPSGASASGGSSPSPSYAPSSGGSSGGAAPASTGSSSGGSAPAGGGASSGAPGAGAVSVDPSSMGEGTAWGKALAAEAFSHAGAASQGLCYRFVGEDLRKFGVQTSGEGAYMAADQLAKCDKFQEVKGLANNDLKKLPAGAVVVWNRGNGHEWGHISIADGHGNEASDFKGPQITNYGTSFRVFLPKGSKGTTQDK